MDGKSLEEGLDGEILDGNMAGMDSDGKEQLVDATSSSEQVLLKNFVEIDLDKLNVSTNKKKIRCSKKRKMNLNSLKNLKNYQTMESSPVSELKTVISQSSSTPRFSLTPQMSLTRRLSKNRLPDFHFEMGEAKFQNQILELINETIARIEIQSELEKIGSPEPKRLKVETHEETIRSSSKSLAYQGRDNSGRFRETPSPTSTLSTNGGSSDLDNPETDELTFSQRLMPPPVKSGINHCKKNKNRFVKASKRRSSESEPNNDLSALSTSATELCYSDLSSVNSVSPFSTDSLNQDQILRNILMSVPMSSNDVLLLQQDPQRCLCVFGLAAYLAYICATDTNRGVIAVHPHFSASHYSIFVNEDDLKAHRFIINPRNIDFANVKIVLIPILTYLSHDGKLSKGNTDELEGRTGHWVLGIFDVMQHTLFFYDPFGHRPSAVASYLLSRAMATMNDPEQNKTIVRGAYTAITRRPDNYNRQSDSINCGYYICLYSEMSVSSNLKTNIKVPDFDISRYKHRVINILIAIFIDANLPPYQPINPESRVLFDQNQAVTNEIIAAIEIPPTEVVLTQIVEILSPVTSPNLIEEESASNEESSCKDSEQPSSLRPLGKKLMKTTACQKKHPGKYCASRSVNHDVSYLHSGKFEYKCPHCNALLLKSEFQSRKRSKCCLSGKVDLSEEFNVLQNPPPEILALHTNPQVNRRSEEFLSNARRYNTEFAFGSIHTKQKPCPPHGPQVVIINGETTFELSDLSHRDGISPVFGQVYALQCEAGLQERNKRVVEKALNPEIVKTLHYAFTTYNQLARVYSWASELREKAAIECAARNQSLPQFRLYLLSNKEARQYHIANPTIHPHLTELPQADQLAVVWMDREGDPPNIDGVYLTGRAGGTRFLRYWDPLVEPACFPVLFPFGNPGYRSGIPLRLTNVIDVDQQKRTVDDGEPQSVDDFVFDEAEFDADKTRSESRRKFVTARLWFRYMMQMRPSHGVNDSQAFHWLWQTRSLAELYSITYTNRTERHDLDYLKNVQNRTNLRKTLPDTLIKALEKGLEPGTTLGNIYMLPVTYPGSRKYMQMHYADTMAIARELGNPTLFLTFTGNPKWPEIKSELYPGQNYTHRPDIVCRVFYHKCRELVKLVWERQIFGRCTSLVFSVEHQKRGMPHIHMLITLEDREEHHTAEFVDEIISAEIPPLPAIDDFSKEAEKARRLHHLVTSLNIHDCTSESPCQIDGKCSKHFPKRLRPTTMIRGDDFPEYRRRAPPPTGEATHFTDEDKYGNTFLKKKKGVEMLIDNSRVVPYSILLMEILESHHDIEYVLKEVCLKYLFKYVMKGRDRAYVRIEGTQTVDYDEIEQMFTAVFMTSPEAIWRIIGLCIIFKTHDVVKQWIYPPEGSAVIFHEGYEREAMEEEAVSLKNNMLLAFFELCRSNKLAATLTYDQLGKLFRFDRQQRKWLRRKLGEKRKIVRVGNVSPTNRQLLCIRILLFHVAGPTSFENLRTVDNVVCESFEEAAALRGLLDDDNVWRRTISDACVEKMSLRDLRKFFAMIIFHGMPAAPKALLNQFLHDLVPALHLSPSIRKQRALCYLEYFFNQWNTCCANVGLDQPDDALFKEVEIEIESESPFVDIAGDPITGNCNSWEQYVERNCHKFNVKQREIFDKIVTAVNDNSSNRLFFIHGAGGTGKTFLYNTIIGWIRSEGKTAIACASTGIAALLLTGGATAHSTFRVPNDVDRETVPCIKWEEKLAQRLRQASIIIIDEISMLDQCVFDFIDKTLRSVQLITDTPKPFGGKVVLIGGDFRQLLPIVRGGNSYDQLNASVIRSSLFPLFDKLSLDQNMRVEPDELAFAEWLDKLGNGENYVSTTSIKVQIPRQCFVRTTQQLIDFCFPSNVLQNPLEAMNEIRNSAILATTNAAVELINNKVQSFLPTSERVYLSVDSLKIRGAEEVIAAGLEFNVSDNMLENLHAQTPSRLPPHKLTLKIGSIVMLIRNIYIPDGLCNGARLQIVRMEENLLYCVLLAGRPDQIRDRPLIRLQRVRFEHGTSSMSRETPFSRIQFPIRLSFAMTINKSQGQTLDRVGVNLDSPVFSHGHLYVALSRVRRLDSIRIKSSNYKCQIDNIVLKEALI